MLYYHLNCSESKKKKHVHTTHLNLHFLCLHFFQFLKKQVIHLHVTLSCKLFQFQILPAPIMIRASGAPTMSNQSEVNIYLRNRSGIKGWSPPGAKPFCGSWLNMLISCPGVCTREHTHTHTSRDVCSPREVEVKDHQPNNKPGGEIKEKTSQSSNCYPET